MKKNFVKNLSFVLAAAMVVTAATLPVSAKAATKSGEVTARYLKEAKSTTAITSKTIWAGGKSVNFDYQYGKKTSGVKGTWTSSDSHIAIDPKTGVAKATGKADAVITFTPDSKKYATLSVNVKGRVRATGVFIREENQKGKVVSSASVEVGKDATFYVSMSTKTKVKSTYFAHILDTNASVASITNGGEDGDYKGDNYGRWIKVHGVSVGAVTVNVKASASTDASNTSTLDVSTPFTVNVVAKDNSAETNDKVQVQTATVAQRGTKKILLTNVPTLAGVTFNKGVTFNYADAVKTQKPGSTPNTYNYEITTYEALTPGVMYVARVTNSTLGLQDKQLGFFYAEKERPVDLVIDGVSGKKINGNYVGAITAKVHLVNQWNALYEQNVATYNGKVVINGTDVTSSYDGGYYTLNLTEGIVGDYARVAASVTTNKELEYFQDADEMTFLIDDKDQTVGYKFNILGFTSTDDKYATIADEGTSGKVFTKTELAAKKYLAFTFDDPDTKGEENTFINSSDFSAYLDGDKNKTALTLSGPKSVTKAGEYSSTANMYFVQLPDDLSADGKSHYITLTYKGVKGTVEKYYAFSVKYEAGAKSEDTSDYDFTQNAADSKTLDFDTMTAQTLFTYGTLNVAEPKEAKFFTNLTNTAGTYLGRVFAKRTADGVLSLVKLVNDGGDVTDFTEGTTNFDYDDSTVANFVTSYEATYSYDGASSAIKATSKVTKKQETLTSTSAPKATTHAYAAKDVNSFTTATYDQTVITDLYDDGKVVGHLEYTIPASDTLTDAQTLINNNLVIKDKDGKTVPASQLDKSQTGKVSWTDDTAGNKYILSCAGKKVQIEIQAK